MDKFIFPSIILSGKDAKSIYRAITVLYDKGTGTELHGLSLEDEGWVATSIEYKSKDNVGKWHCHGHGKNPSIAVRDMLKKIRNFKSQ